MVNNDDHNILYDIYYKPENLWHGKIAIQKLSEASKLSEEKTKKFLFKQAIWQIYLPKPKKIPRIQAGGPQLEKNYIHQADLLFLSQDNYNNKKYKYALNVVDIATRFKESEPLQTKKSTEVAKAFQQIYKRSKLTYPKILQVDAGTEFKGAVRKLMLDHSVKIQVGEPGNHRDQSIVERFNGLLAKQLYTNQYAQEMIFEDVTQRSREWVKSLPNVIKVFNNSKTRLIHMKPNDAMKSKKNNKIKQIPSSIIKKRLVGIDEKKINLNFSVRYLYRNGELEGDERKRITDPIWSTISYKIKNILIIPNQPVLYYLKNSPTLRSFVREEILVIPFNTELPPTKILEFYNQQLPSNAKFKSSYHQQSIKQFLRK